MPPHGPKPISKLTFKPFLEKKKQKESNPRSRRESRVVKIAHTTLDCTGLVAPQHRRDHTQPLARSHLATCEITPPEAPPRSHPNTSEIAPMTHPCPISHCLDLHLPFPQLPITLFHPLSLFDRIFEFNECFVLIFVSFKFIYWNFLLWNLFGSWENVKN